MHLKWPGTIKPHGEWPTLKPADVDQSSSVVAMMGVEPIVRALEGGAQSCLPVAAAIRPYSPAPP